MYFVSFVTFVWMAFHGVMAQPDGFVMTQDNMNCPGNDIFDPPFTGITPQECVERCNGCEIILYDWNTNRCYPKYTCDNLEVLASHQVFRRDCKDTSLVYDLTKNTDACAAENRCGSFIHVEVSLEVWNALQVTFVYFKNGNSVLIDRKPTTGSIDDWETVSSIQNAVADTVDIKIDWNLSAGGSGYEYRAVSFASSCWDSLQAPCEAIYENCNDAPQAVGWIVTEIGYDCSGNDLGFWENLSLKECTDQCGATGGCVAVLYHPDSSRCWLKSECSTFQPGFPGFFIYRSNGSDGK